MSEKRICPHCGVERTDDSLSGLCPKCLARFSFFELEGDAGVIKPAENQDRTQKVQQTPKSDFKLEYAGVMIGRYKLLQQIGEGGFGVVYMAEQMEPVRRRVALKIIKAGMDTKEVIARFEAERQALALMDHANIARVLDGGTTQAGRPYFVMELVRGVPITDYCDANRLPPRERIELFRKVCQAVQHAHQKGIVHRDLKPSNILVTVQDDAPLPKIIDFGVAKALQSSLTERTLFTRYNQWIGTPAYMSPEQASLGSLDVDTRSDIYSLGTILYELLTGHTPFDAQALRKKGHDAILQTIREEDVPMASTRLSSLARDELQTVADHRGRSPEKLESTLKGELDWILLKALERNRARRYETANALAKDLERYCEGEPISAAPPSFFYQTGKFVHRHWKPVSVVVTIAVLVVAGAITSAVLAFRAKRAEDAARKAESKAVASQEEMARKHYNASMLLARMSWDDHNAGITREIIESLYPLEGTADHRGWEWYYMQSLLHQEVHVLENDGSPVFALAWSPDSRRIAAAGGDGVIRIWDPVTGKRIQQLGSHPPEDAETTSEISSLAWSPDGRRIYAGLLDGRVVGWNLATAMPDFEILSAHGGVTAIALGSRGARLATGTAEGALEIWEVATRRPVDQQVPATDEVSDAATSRQVSYHVAKLGAVVGLTISPDDERLLSVHRDGRVAAWQISDGTRLYETRLSETLSGGAISQNGARLYLCGHNRRYSAIVDARTGAVLVENRNNLDWAGDAIVVSPDGEHVCTAGNKGEILVRDASMKRSQWICPGRSRDVTRLSYSPGGRWLASAAADGKVSLWNVRRMKEASVEIPLSNLYMTARWSPVDDRLAIDEMMQFAKVVDGTDGSLIHKLGPHRSRTSFVAWSRNGDRVATGGYFEPLKLWDASTGLLLRSLASAYRSTFDAVWSPNGDKVAALSTETARPVNQNEGPWKLCIWDADTGRLIHEMDGVFSGAKHMDWSYTDLLAVPCSPKKQVNIYDAVGGELIAALPINDERENDIRCVRWSPDGRFLAGGLSSGTLYVWEMATKKAEHVLSAHTDRIFDIAWSPDGSRFATASWDATVKIWNAQTGELVFLLRNPNQAQDRNKGFWTVDWSHDGTKLVTGSMDGYVRIYDAGRGYQISGTQPTRPANEFLLPPSANLQRKDQQ